MYQNVIAEHIAKVPVYPVNSENATLPTPVKDQFIFSTAVGVRSDEVNQVFTLSGSATGKESQLSTVGYCFPIMPSFISSTKQLLTLQAQFIGFVNSAVISFGVIPYYFVDADVPVFNDEFIIKPADVVPIHFFNTNQQSLSATGRVLVDVERSTIPTSKLYFLVLMMLTSVSATFDLAGNLALSARLHNKDYTFYQPMK